jgi:hypothetical protein
MNYLIAIAVSFVSGGFSIVYLLGGDPSPPVVKEGDISPIAAYACGAYDVIVEMAKSSNQSAPVLPSVFTAECRKLHDLMKEMGMPRWGN